MASHAVGHGCFSSVFNGSSGALTSMNRPRRQEAPAPQPETVSEAPAPAEEREAEPARSEGEENDGTLAL